MSGTLGIIEVTDAHRSRCKFATRGTSAARRFGNKSLLEWVARRVTDSLLIDQVAVVVDPLQAAALVRLVPPDVRVFEGTQPDALSRLAAAVRKYDADHVVLVPWASPFVDPELIDRLVCTAAAHPGSDYIGYTANRGGPAVLSRLGVFAEWCRAEAIFRADRDADRLEDRQEATRYVISHPELFRLRLIPVPPQLDRDDVRLTIDHEEDWDHAQIIFEALGPDRLDWQGIAGLLDQQPAMRQRMAVLNQAEQDNF